MAVLSNNVIAGASIADDAAGDDTYKIEKSLRFNSGDSANLTRTPGSKGNTRTWTISTWVKAMNESSGHHLFGAYGSSKEFAVTL